MSTDTTSIILKTDSRGRVRTPRHRREELLAEFERSGLPATQFAALAGVRYQTFATWVQQRRKRDGGGAAAESAASSTKPVRFAEVSIEGTSAPVAVAMPLRVRWLAARRCRWPCSSSRLFAEVRHAELHRQPEGVRGA